MKDINDWLNAVKTAKNSVEVFRVLDDFRPGQWTDDERALMSKTYIAILSNFATLDFNSDEKATHDSIAMPADTEDRQITRADGEEVLDQESVWYERL